MNDQQREELAKKIYESLDEIECKVGMFGLTEELEIIRDRYVNALVASLVRT